MTHMHLLLPGYAVMLVTKLVMPMPALDINCQPVTADFSLRPSLKKPDQSLLDRRLMKFFGQ
jgi:hypothetical protein